MSKFLLNLLVQISKALVNSKIPFLRFRPGRPCGPLSLWPSQPTGCAAPAGRNHLGRPIQPVRRSRLRGIYVFPFWFTPSASVACSACPFRPSPLCLSISAIASFSLTGGPTLSVSPGSSPSSNNARARRAATAPRPPSAAQLHASCATGPLPPRLHFRSLKSPL
jgi:hypothetical protein